MTNHIQSTSSALFEFQFIRLSMALIDDHPSNHKIAIELREIAKMVQAAMAHINRMKDCQARKIARSKAMVLLNKLRHKAQKIEKQIESDNEEFEQDLHDLCYKYLDPEIDVERYVNATLNEMNMGYGFPYRAPDGKPYSFEIPARDSIDKIPHCL